MTDIRNIFRNTIKKLVNHNYLDVLFLQDNSVKVIFCKGPYLEDIRNSTKESLLKILNKYKVSYIEEGYTIILTDIDLAAFVGLIRMLQLK